MARKSIISKRFCKVLIFICLVLIIYILATNFLFVNNEGLTDYVTGGGHAVENKNLSSSLLNKPVNIISMQSNKCLNVINCEGGDDKCQLSTGEALENAKWIITETGGGWYSITNLITKKKLSSVYCNANQMIAGTNFVEMAKTDQAGNNLFNEGSTLSLEECKNACAENINCNGFVYSNTNPNCWQKSSVATSQPNPNTDTYIAERGNNICYPSLWGSGAEQSWHIIQDNDIVYLKNFTNNYLGQTYCWTGTCKLNMYGNANEVRWKIVLAKNTPPVGKLCLANARCGFDINNSSATDTSNCAVQCQGSPFSFNQDSKICYCGTDNYIPGTYGKCGIINEIGASIYSGDSSCDNLLNFKELVPS